MENGRMNGLTPRQVQTLNFIRDWIRVKQYSPSYQEIADGMGLGSKHSVHDLIHGLVERGHLTMLPGRRRTLRPVE